MYAKVLSERGLQLVVASSQDHEPSNQNTVQDTPGNEKRCTKKPPTVGCRVPVWIGRGQPTMTFNM